MQVVQLTSRRGDLVIHRVAKSVALANIVKIHTNFFLSATITFDQPIASKFLSSLDPHYIWIRNNQGLLITTSQGINTHFLPESIIDNFNLVVEPLDNNLAATGTWSINSPPPGDMTQSASGVLS